MDPAKLATLGPRGANWRVEKYVALLAEAKADKVAPKKVAAKAVSLVGMKGKAASLTAAAMVRNGDEEKAGRWGQEDEKQTEDSLGVGVGMVGPNVWAKCLDPAALGALSNWKWVQHLKCGRATWGS